MSLADAITAGGATHHGGQDVRVIDIPADANENRGIFEKLPDAIDDPASFAEHLKRMAAEQKGHAFVTFVEKLFAEDNSDKVAREVATNRQRWLDKYLLPNADGQVIRVARRFALVVATRKLATRLGILPWSRQEAVWSASICFGDWLQARGGLGSAEVSTARERLRAFVNLHGDTRFQPLRQADILGNDRKEIDWRTVNRAGYVRRESEQVEYLFFQQGWKIEIVQGLDTKSINHALCCVDYGGKFQKQAITHRLDDATAVFGYLGID